MKTSDLHSLIHQKDSPCISIILPTERIERKKNYEVLKKAIQKVTAILDNDTYTDEIKNLITLKLNDTLRTLPSTTLQGLGIYISPKHALVVQFPFQVKQKIMVNDNFETRDLFYLEQYLEPYYVLSLSRQSVQLFSATKDKLTEISDQNFPMLYSDQYEYAKPAIANSNSNSLQSFEKEKSTISNLRIKTMLAEADDYLKPYLQKEDAKIIAAGIQKITSIFLQVTKYKKHIVGKVQGSFVGKEISLLSERAWKAFVEYKKKSNEQLVQKFMEQKDGHLAEGVQEAWQAAQEGNSLLLAVEKDFHCQGYQKPNDYKIFLRPPKKPYSIIPDVVDDLIENVSKKKGDIVFLEDDMLKQSGHLAMVLRYKEREAI